jgi:CRP/FNR family transcriptional regulator, anaerobic regulatory protein
MLTCGNGEAIEFTTTLRRTASAGHSPDSLAAQFSGTPSRRVEAKEHVFCEGDAVRHVYRVEAGLICTYRMMSDGRRQVVDFAFPGDIVGLGANGEHATSAQAIRPTRLRCLPAAVLTDVMRRDSRLTVKLYETLAEELRAARELLLSVCQRSAAERLAAFLVALVRRNERRGLDAETLDLGMTRTDIADFLGLTIETVSRTFTKFRSSGLIDIAQCTSIAIVDRVGLEELAAGGGRHSD